MHTIRLRRATQQDVALLAEWERRPHVIAAIGHDRPRDWTTALTTAHHESLIAEQPPRPIGYLRIIDPALEPHHYWGEVELNLRAISIWIADQNDLGKGFGTQMMTCAIDLCFADLGVRAVVVNPLTINHEARRFYRNLGFVEVGPAVSMMAANAPFFD